MQSELITGVKKGLGQVRRKAGGLLSFALSRLNTRLGIGWLVRLVCLACLAG